MKTVAILCQSRVEWGKTRLSDELPFFIIPVRVFRLLCIPLMDSIRITVIQMWVSNPDVAIVDHAGTYHGYENNTDH